MCEGVDLVIGVSRFKNKVEIGTSSLLSMLSCLKTYCLMDILCCDWGGYVPVVMLWTGMRDVCLRKQGSKEAANDLFALF